MTSKVIEGHKSSSNFSVNQTLPLLDGPLMLPPPSRTLFPSLSLTFSLYLPLLLYAKIFYTQWKVFRYAVSLYVTYFCVRLYSGIRLSCKSLFLSCFNLNLRSYGQLFALVFLKNDANLTCLIVHITSSYLFVLYNMSN